LGGGDVPATPTAPAFTIDGFSDISFDQRSGWALRAGAKYQMTTHWSVQPQYIHWNVSASTVNSETATFTVNGITVRQRLGAYEPLNRTNEFVVKLGFRF
jgi:opacity protein-like surface antigen